MNTYVNELTIKTHRGEDKKKAANTTITEFKKQINEMKKVTKGKKRKKKIMEKNETIKIMSGRNIGDGNDKRTLKINNQTSTQQHFELGVCSFHLFQCNANFAFSSTIFCSFIQFSLVDFAISDIQKLSVHKTNCV